MRRIECGRHFSNEEKTRGILRVPGPPCPNMDYFAGQIKPSKKEMSWKDNTGRKRETGSELPSDGKPATKWNWVVGEPPARRMNEKQKLKNGKNKIK